jgi:broad specificity phosphatase PhoE
VGRVLLLRHGQSTWNAERRWQGRADPPLSPEGEAQARAAAAALTDTTWAAVFASHLQRARRTAELIADELELGEVRLVEDLVERDVGHWSGLTSDEIEEQWPGQLASWRSGTLGAIPGGEGDITARVVPAVEELAREAAAHEASFLVVTHGGVIGAVERATGVEPSRARNLCGRWFSTPTRT